MSTATTAAFGHLLRQHRNAAGLTQVELAERAGLAGRAISDLERGARTHPYRDTVQRLADALALSEPEREGLFAASRRVVGPRPEPGADAVEPIPPDPPRPDSSRSPIRHNLPVPLSSFVGRERELAEVRRLLVAPGSTTRLLALTGPPGVGKTRLAIEVGLAVVGDFPDGIHFTSLATVADPNLVLSTIARGCGIEGYGGPDLIDRLSQRLHGKRTLLVLDNFEPVAAAAPSVAQLLERCPTLKALVTSRSRLHVRGEHELGVRPLPILETQREQPKGAELVASVCRIASVRLFVDRASEARSDFGLTPVNAPAVAEICRQLDGIPLAIELAARRSKVLSPTAILAHLRDRFQLLTAGPLDGPVHQQTLYQAIAWSYDFLSPGEQQLFRHLAVFVGGFTLQSASLLVDHEWEEPRLRPDPAEAPTSLPTDEVPGEQSRASALRSRGGCDDGKAWGWGTGGSEVPVDRPSLWLASAVDHPVSRASTVLGGLESFVDRSLVDVMGGGIRFRMLETIRAFGLEQLAATGEAEVLNRRHAACFRALAEDAAAHFRGPREGEWIDVLDREHDNLRAALRFLIDRKQIGEALRLAGILQWLWMIRGYADETSSWLGELLPLAEGTEFLADRARMLRATACSEFPTAFTYARLQESLAISREIGDPDSIADSLARLGLVTRDQGHYDIARALFEESLEIYRVLGNQAEIAAQLDRIGMVAFYAGESSRACSLLEESLAIRRTQGDQIFLGWALHEFGRILHGVGEPGRAGPLYEEALAIWREVGYHDGVGCACASLGDLQLDRNDIAAAQRLLTESLVLFPNLSEAGEGALVLELFAGLAAARGDNVDAIRLAGAAAGVRQRNGWPQPPDYKSRLDRRLAGARQALGEIGVATATAEGKAMTRDDAFALALQI